LILHLNFDREILEEIPDNQQLRAAIARNELEVEVIDEILKEETGNP
jgi:hypothetical protein